MLHAISCVLHAASNQLPGHLPPLLPLSDGRWALHDAGPWFCKELLHSCLGYRLIGWKQALPLQSDERKSPAKPITSCRHRVTSRNASKPRQLPFLPHSVTCCTNLRVHENAVFPTGNPLDFSCTTYVAIPAGSPRNFAMPTGNPRGFAFSLMPKSTGKTRGFASTPTLQSSPAAHEIRVHDNPHGKYTRFCVHNNTTMPQPSLETHEISHSQ